MSKTLLTFVIFCFSFSVNAEEEIRYYDVEVILFENLDLLARQSENWPNSVELELPETKIEIGQPYPGPIPKQYQPRLTFKPLAKKNLQLKEQAAKIDESESRRLLLHTGWRQPGMPRDKALSVYFKHEIPARPGANAESDQPSGINRFAQPEAGELEGLIKVILSRYLHVDSDIVFRPQPVALTDDFFSFESFEEANQPVVYRMKQTRRRMRSRELHYLDNPVIGMLILITPYETN